MAQIVDPQLVSSVFESEDLLPIVLNVIRKYNLSLLLDKCTLVCKLWNRVIRTLDTPDKSLRLLKQKKEAWFGLYDGNNRFELSRILWGFGGALGTGLTLATTVQECMSMGGWNMREARRLSGNRLWHNGQTWTVPPLGFAPNEDFIHRFNVSQSEWEMLLGGTEEEQDAYWINHLGKMGLGPLKLVVDPSKMEEHPLELCGSQPYAEISLGAKSWIHPIHVRIPEKAHRVGFQRSIAINHLPADAEYTLPPPLDPVSLHWELLSD